VILRAALALSVVALAAPFAGDVSRCNQSDAWLCGPLHTVESLGNRIVAGADRVRDDFRGQRSHPLSGGSAF
jgi:hypothetical protein